jgi:hypothetical protein
VGLSSLGTAATSGLFYKPDDRWGWLWSNWWHEEWQGKPKYSEKTCPRATLSTTNPTWPDPSSNPGRRGGKPATNRLSYGTALNIWDKQNWWLTLKADKEKQSGAFVCSNMRNYNLQTFKSVAYHRAWNVLSWQMLSACKYIQ